MEELIIGRTSFEKLLLHLKTIDVLAFDTETTGLIPFRDKIIGISVSDGNTCQYLPLLTWCKDTQKLIEVNPWDYGKRLVDLLKTKELLTWNGIFDCRMVKYNFQVELISNVVCDGVILKHLLNEESIYGLKETAIEYQDLLGINAEKAANQEQIELKENVKANGGEWKQGNKEMYKADLEVMSKYAAKDALLTYKLCDIFQDQLIVEGLDKFFFDDECMPLYREVTYKMEDTRIKLDLPLIEKTNVKITKALAEVEKEVVEELTKLLGFDNWLEFYLLKNIKITKFKTEYIKYHNLEKYFKMNEKSGTFSLGKKSVESMPESIHKQFFLSNDLQYAQDMMVILKNIHLQENKYLINISSKDQLKKLLFDFFGLTPDKVTEKGSPQFNDGFIDSLADTHTFASKLSIYNKLNKIKGTYIDRFLNGHIDGYYNFYYKQHGTVSGRYGSDAQQLPRPKEEGELPPEVLPFNNVIRSFFIVDEDEIFIDVDYTSLEPHVFSVASNEPLLQEIFNNNHDFYSTIAIRTEKLEGYSADPQEESYLGKLNKPLRQRSKAYCLGVVYGLSAFKLSKSLDISKEEAQKCIDDYLEAFPNLKKWMEDSEVQAKTQGYVKTLLGRKRHLNFVKETYERFGDGLLDWNKKRNLEKRYGKDKIGIMKSKYKNGLNNAKNFQIQGLSASIVNRAAIAVNRALAANDICGHVVSQVHDQLIIKVKKKDEEKAKEICQHEMENVVKLPVKLKAPAESSINWKEGH